MFEALLSLLLVAMLAGTLGLGGYVSWDSITHRHPKPAPTATAPSGNRLQNVDGSSKQAETYAPRTSPAPEADR